MELSQNLDGEIEEPGVVDSPRPFRETSLLAGSYTLVGYSMACGMYSNVA